MSAPPPPLVLNIMSSYGSLLVGTFISQAVWGISTMQTYLYYKNYEADHIYLKLIVAVLWLIDTADQILLMKGTFPLLILQYGNFSILSEIVIEFVVHTWLEAAVIFVVQMYFIRRIYLFHRGSKLIIIYCSILVLLTSWQLVGCIIYWVMAFGKTLAYEGKPELISLNISLRAAAAVVDILISASMVYLLTRGNAPRMSKTKKMIFRALTVTINSGTWTALVSLVVLILLKVYPTTLEYCNVELSLCSLYFSTFLANLNSRNFVKGDNVVNSISMGDLTDPRAGSTLVFGSKRSGRNNIPKPDVATDMSDAKGAAIYIGREVYSDSDAISKAV